MATNPNVRVTRSMTAAAQAAAAAANASGLPQLDTDLQFLVDTIFNCPAPPGETHNEMHRALIAQNVNSIHHLLTIPAHERNIWTYPEPQPNDASGNPVPDIDKALPKHHYGLFTTFVGYSLYRDIELKEPMDLTDFQNAITRDQFQQYRSSGHLIMYVNNQLPPTPSVRPRYGQTPAEEFLHGIKRDPTAFPHLKDAKDWDHYNRVLTAQAHVQKVETVLDPSYKPIGQQQHQLFRLQNDYMYAVFTTTLFLDQGKTLVRQFQSTRDAQKIYAALKEHCTKSVRADITAGDLLTAITNDRLTADTWSGTREAFLLHWLDLVRQHTELTSPNAPLTQEVLRTLLDNAVSFDPDLARVKATHRQLNIINPGMPMNYDSYVSLLQSTAETIDATGKPLASFPTNVASRRVYVADSAPPVISDFDHSTNPYSAFQSRSSLVPRLPPDLYSQLDPTTCRQRLNWQARKPCTRQKHTTKKWSWRRLLLWKSLMW